MKRTNFNATSLSLSLCPLPLQLNTDIETHVRSMSTRRRIPSKSTEDVGDRQFNTNTDGLYVCSGSYASRRLLCFRLRLLWCATWSKSCSTWTKTWFKRTSTGTRPAYHLTKKKKRSFNNSLCITSWNCVPVLLAPSLLTPLWNNSVKILYQVATQHPQQEGLMVFCQRLLYTLQVSP